MTKTETRKATTTTGAAVGTTGLSECWTLATVEAETATATETKILPKRSSVTMVTRQMWIKKKEEIVKIKLQIADQIVTMEMEVEETEKELIKEGGIEKIKTPRIDRMAAESRKTGTVRRTRIETRAGGDQTTVIGDRGQNQGGTVEPAEMETEETEKVQEQTDEGLQLNYKQTFSV